MKKNRTCYFLLLTLFLTLCGCGSRSKIRIDNTDFTKSRVIPGAPKEILDKYTVGDVLVIPLFRTPYKKGISHRFEMAVMSSRFPVPGMVDAVRIMVNDELTDFGKDLAGTPLASAHFKTLESGKWFGYLVGAPLPELTQRIDRLHFELPTGEIFIKGGQLKPVEGEQLKITVEVDVSVEQDGTGTVARRTLVSDYEIRKIRYSLIPTV